MDTKNYALLSIGAVLLFLLFFFNVGHAAHIDGSQASPIVPVAEPNRLTEVFVEPAYILFGVGLIGLVVGLIVMVALAVGGWRFRHGDNVHHVRHVL